jgi:hypothetical protein
MFIYLFIIYYLFFIYVLLYNFFIRKIGDWGLGIGDWGLGIGDWGQSPKPQTHNPQTH